MGKDSGKILPGFVEGFWQWFITKRYEAGTDLAKVSVRVIGKF